MLQPSLVTESTLTIHTPDGLLIDSYEISVEDDIVPSTPLEATINTLSTSLFKVNCSMVPSHSSTMEAKANCFDSQTPVERVTGLSIRLETLSSIVSIKPIVATLSS